jgi:glycosyltransferase involved in cell wall biosynthesis
VPVSLHDHRRMIFEDRLEAVLRGLRDFKPNVIVATLAPFAFEVLRYAPRGISRIGMVQSDDPLVYKLAEKYASCMDGIVGVSGIIAQRLEKMDAFRGVAKHYLPYGVAMPEQLAQRGGPSASLRILYLGRVNKEQKRVHLFPQIAASLAKAQVPFRWTIAGDGPDRAALEAKMKSSEIGPRVDFIGVVRYADVGPLLDAHDVFILVSDYEGLPVSLLEAMGHGVVPIVSDLESGVRDVVNESNGVLVSVDDIEGYARAIIHLDKNRDALATKSSASRQRVRTEFSVAAMTDRWLAVIDVGVNRIEWPRHFRIRGVLIDPQKWKYVMLVRSVRRLLKNLGDCGDT